jgi:DNA-binding NarL/FixJ family response regulator
MIRVVLADDHAMFRQSLAALLRSKADVAVVGEAGNGVEALDVLQNTLPDVAILDVSMPGMDGLAVSRTIRDQGWPIRVLLLTMLGGPDMPKRARAAGAHGLLLKDNTFEELLTALEAVMNGTWYVSSALNGMDVGAGLNGEPASGLSVREQDILRGIAAGRSNRLLAEELGISVKTVDTHRARIMRKLNARSTADLVRYALNHGLE